MNTPITTVAILGAGHGGCAAAADLTRRGFSVRIYSRNEQTVAPLKARGGIEYEGALGEGFAPLALITSDIGAAMSGADLVICMVPTQAHESMATLLAPNLEPGQLLLLAPGHTLLLVPLILRRMGCAHPVHCETGTLPYICRKSSPERVRITKANQHLLFAVFPGRMRARDQRAHAPGAAYPSGRSRASSTRSFPMSTRFTIRRRYFATSAASRRPAGTTAITTTASARRSAG